MLLVNEAKAALRPIDDRHMIRNLRNCVYSLYREDTDFDLDRSRGHEVWKAYLTLVTKLSAYLTRTLPNYWKILKSFVDGKYQKSGTRTGTNRSPTQTRQLSIEIGKQFISLIGQAFTLSDLSIATSPSQNGDALPFEFIPDGSTSITTAYFSTKILAELVECMIDLEGIGVSGEVERASAAGSKVTDELRNAAKAMIESCRWRFVEAMCDTWAKDAKRFFGLETWDLNPEVPGTTIYLVQLNALQRHCASMGWQLAGGSNRTGRNDTTVPPVFISRLKNAFFDSLYYLLDGLVHLAFAEQAPPEHLPALLRNNTKKFDPRDIESRILLTISNLQHLKSSILPKLMESFQALYSVDISTDKQTLWEVTDQLNG